MGLSQFITLNNLNTVYHDLRERIGALGNVYHVKGSITWGDLLNLSEVTSGEVYNIICKDADGNIISPGNYPEDPLSTPNTQITDGTNIVCKQNITFTIPSSSWANYWEVLNGVLEIATDSTPGMIKLGASDTVNGSGLTEVSRKLQAENSNAYVTIPIADENTYGLVSTGPQTLGGDKTFQGNVILEGPSLSAPNTTANINNLQASILQVGNVKITTSGATIIFST